MIFDSYIFERDSALNEEQRRIFGQRVELRPGNGGRRGSWRCFIPAEKMVECKIIDEERTPKSTQNFLSRTPK